MQLESQCWIISGEDDSVAWEPRHWRCLSCWENWNWVPEDSLLTLHSFSELCVTFFNCIYTNNCCCSLSELKTLGKKLIVWFSLFQAPNSKSMRVFVCFLATSVHSLGIILESHLGQRKLTQAHKENLSVLSVANVGRYSPEETACAQVQVNRKSLLASRWLSWAFLEVKLKKNPGLTHGS